jgi:hypothetical protein
MSDVVRGNFCIIYLKLGSVYYPVACTKDVEISFDSDLIEAAPRSSSHFREYEYGRISGQITGSSLVKVDTAPDNLYTVFDITGFQLSQQKLMAKYSIQDPDGNLKVFEANTLIRNTTLTKTAGQMLGGSYALQITGKPTLTTTPVANTNPQILIYEHTATGGETSLDLSVLGPDATIIVVYIKPAASAGGSSHEVKIAPEGYSGTQVQYDPTSQLLNLGAALGAGDYVKVIYVDTDAVTDTSLYLEDGTGEFIEDGTGEEITSG